MTLRHFFKIENMTKEQINKELNFLETLKEITTQHLLESGLDTDVIPKDFDVAKAISVINRVIYAETDFLLRNPEEYLAIYGS